MTPDALNLPHIKMGAKSAKAPLTQSYDKGPTTELINLTIGDFFDQIVEQNPDKEALISAHQNSRLTYRQLQRKVNQLASSRIRMGLQKGDHVGIWSHNNVEWVIMQLATAKAGIVLVNINPAYRTFELEYAINKVDCQVLVLMRHVKSSDTAMSKSSGVAKTW